jgi:hypothetical protein
MSITRPIALLAIDPATDTVVSDGGSYGFDLSTFSVDTAASAWSCELDGDAAVPDDRRQVIVTGDGADVRLYRGLPLVAPALGVAVESRVPSTLALGAANGIVRVAVYRIGTAG